MEIVQQITNAVQAVAGGAPPARPACLSVAVADLSSDSMVHHSPSLDACGCTPVCTQWTTASTARWLQLPLPFMFQVKFTSSLASLCSTSPVSKLHHPARHLQSSPIAHRICFVFPKFLCASAHFPLARACVGTSSAAQHRHSPARCQFQLLLRHEQKTYLSTQAQLGSSGSAVDSIWPIMLHHRSLSEFISSSSIPTAVNPFVNVHAAPLGQSWASMTIVERSDEPKCD